MSDKTKGIIALLIASFGFALMSIFVRLAGDVPVVQKVFFRNGVSLIVALIMITMNKGTYYGKKKNQPLLLLRSGLGTVGMLLFFYSLANIDVSADANALNKLSSFFLILFSFIFLREKIKPYQIIAILIAFLGSLLIIKPSFDIDLLPYLAAILAAMFAGGAYTVLRVLGKKEKSYTVVLYFSTFSVVALTPFVILNYQPMTFEQVGFLILTGLGATVGQFGTTIAYRLAPASEISIFNYSNVVFVTLIALPLLGEVPDIISVVGYVVIFIASFMMFKVKK